MRQIFAAVLALVAGCIALAGLPDNASAQKRVAFVVGTDKYDNLDKTRQLQRAVNDARAVGAAFKALGFDVLAAENLTRGQFNGEWQKFLDKLATGDTAAIYYAGHGVEIEGLNFLLPRDIPDIKFGRQEQIKRESLSVAEILLDLRGRNPEIALVILDACRDNPLIPDEMRSAGTRGGGLAALKGEPPKGTFIMYSAGAGESALDRLPGNDPDRENSIFTRKLVPLLATKGLALHDMARQLRVDVIELASTVPHAQRPAYYDGVVGKYCLAGCEGAAIAPKRVEPSATSQGSSEAERAWALVRDTPSPAALEAFIRRFGDTFYGDLAKARLAELKQQADAVQQVTKKKADDAARAKEEAERRRLAILQQEDERKRAEAEAARRLEEPKTQQVAKAPSIVRPGVGVFPHPTSEPVTIGFGMSLTGGLGANGKSAVLAQKIWEEDVNSRGGLLGRSVKLIYYDDQTNPSTVPGIYVKLLDVDKVDLIIGGYGTNMLAPAMPLAVEKKKVFIGLLGLGVNADFNYSRYFAMMPFGPSAGPLTKGFFDVAVSQAPKPTTVAILGADAEFARNACNGARENANKVNLSIVYDKTYPPGTTDFSTLVRAIQATNPDIVVICSYPPDSVGIVRAVNEIGFKPKMIGGAMVGLQSSSIKAQLGPLLNGWTNYDFWLPTAKMDFPGVSDLMRRYQDRAGAEGADPLGYYMAPLAYAQMQVLEQAIQSTMSLDDDKLAEHMRSNTFNTVVGEVKFGKGGEWAAPRVLQVQYQHIKGNDVAQFRGVTTQVIVAPDKYASGKFVYPYERGK